MKIPFVDILSFALYSTSVVIRGDHDMRVLCPRLHKLGRGNVNSGSKNVSSFQLATGAIAHLVSRAKDLVGQIRAKQELVRATANIIALAAPGLSANSQRTALRTQFDHALGMNDVSPQGLFFEDNPARGWCRQLPEYQAAMEALAPVNQGSFPQIVSRSGKALRREARA